MGYRDFLRETADYVKGEIEERVGFTMVEREKLEVLEAVQVDYRAQSKQLDLLGWSTLDYLSSNPHEMRPQKRLEAVRRARQAWQHDPMAGSAIDFMNDYVFGRGVPAPRARNPEVQKVIDGAWNDPDNVAVLTGYMAQVAMGSDLSLQSNIFVLFFNDGEDGKVKLGLLDHDTVIDAVRDPENRLRVLYYVATYTETEWDFQNDGIKPVDPSDTLTPAGKKKIRYYAHWKNVADAEAEVAAGARKRDSLPKPPDEKMGEGLVYHISVNRLGEMVFGVPAFQRSMRWFSAYNELMSARVDMAKAAAELIMKRKVKSTPGGLSRLAQDAMARGGEIATTPDPTRIGGLPAGTIYENENVTHEGFKLDSGAANANVDATMIRSQVSAGVRLPQHFLGDQGNANLATATAMDPPVTKMTEARQELFEQLFRAFADMTIEQAVKKGILKGDLPGEEDAEVTDKGKIGESVEDGKKLDGTKDAEGDEGSEGLKDGKMDLSYEFKMPKPVSRLMSDLVNSINMVAKTFDPNGTNVELSRTLLTIALGEGLELQDPSEAVKRIFPAGYVDPLIQMELDQGEMAQQQMQAPPPAPAPASGGGSGGDGGLTMDGLTKNGGTPAVGGEPGSGKRGPFGTKSKGTLPEEVKEALAESFDRRTVIGRRLYAQALAVLETRFADLPPEQQRETEDRLVGMDAEFEQIVEKVADEMIAALPEVAALNGHT